MLTTGMILNDVAKPGTGLRDVTFLLLIAGYPTTLVSGIILLSHLGDNRRYSVYIGNGKAGFAYNF
jgi:hypothetical protein